jgi:hypothetical protein
VAFLSVLVLHTLRCARQRAWRQFGYGLSGLIAGLFNRRGAPVWLEV